MLIIEQLDFRYQYRQILKQLSFQSQPGELIHVTGPNGAGKSTLMTILAGLKREHAGRIRYLDNQNREVEDRREVIEYLSAEANALYGKMDAMTNLRFWQGLRRQHLGDEQLVKELQYWDLGHPLLRTSFPVERFSTGMKRRLALARVRLSGCPCWLLDEPLYGLDTKAIEAFQTMLAEHLNQGGEAWIVSHDTAPLQKFNLRTLSLHTENSR